MANLNFNNVYIKDYFTIVGPKEKDSKITNYNLKFCSDEALSNQILGDTS